MNDYYSCIKAIFLVAFFTLINTTNVYALPGWKSTQLRQWIKSHSFLSPNFTEMGAGASMYFIAHRNIEGGKQVFVEYSDSDFSENKNFTYQIVKLYAEVKNNSELNKVEGLWKRDSDKAYSILKNVYNNLIAEDYKQSKFVFKEIDFYTEMNSYSPRREKLKDIPTQTGEMWDKGEVSFFKGNKYAYEVDSKSSLITIFSLKDLTSQINIIQHNNKIHDLYLEREKRKLPAKIDL